MEPSSSAKRSIPPAFPPVLQAFAREVLRQHSTGGSPSNEDGHEWIYRFAVTYFEKGGAPVHQPHVHKKRPTSAAARPPSAVKPASDFPSAEELQARIITIFREADRDHSNTLDHREFRTVVKRFASELHLPVADVRQLMSLADENADGVIDYAEFVPLALGVLETVVAQRKFAAAREAREAGAGAGAKRFLLKGLSPAELEAAIREVFAEADADGSGTLSRSEFQAALRGSSLGLTRREINVLMAEADDNGDGAISYAEFAPVAFSLLSEMVAKQMEYAQLPVEEAQVADYILRLFQLYDPEGTGRLSLADVASALRESDLGLSALQLQAVLSEAHANGEGTVAYADFAVAAAGLVAAMTAVAADASQAERVLALRSSAELTKVLGMDAETFKAQLLDVLSACVKDDSGRASVHDVTAVLRDDLAFSAKQINAILNLARATGGAAAGSTVDVAAVVNGSFDVLRQLVEWEALRVPAASTQ